MGIDIFVPGNTLDIEYLHEQIWFDVDADSSNKPNVTGIFDILIRNSESNPVLNGVWAVFPYDCTGLRDVWPSNPETYPDLQKAWKRLHPHVPTRPDVIRIQPIIVTPRMPKKYGQYNWPYRNEPEQRGNNHVRWVPVKKEISYSRLEPIHNDSYYDGLSLRVTVDFHDEMKSNISFLRILSGEKIQKTIVHLLFKSGLKPGEKGWLRLIVKPIQLLSIQPIEKKVPCMPYPIAYEHKLHTTCPILIREELKRLLEEFYQKNSNPLILKHYFDLLPLIYEKGFLTPGTSSRIIDHRVTLVACNNNIDIFDMYSTPGIYFHGTFQMNETFPGTAFLWGGGSDRNRTEDLVHNARRVIDKLRASGTDSWVMADLVRDLAPSGKNEAFWFLIRQMIRVGLIREHEELLKINQDVLDPNMERRLCELRVIYSMADVNEDKKDLLNEFRELHPFKIDCRLRWNNMSKDIENWWKERHQS